MTRAPVAVSWFNFGSIHVAEVHVTIPELPISKTKRFHFDLRRAKSTIAATTFSAPKRKEKRKKKHRGEERPLSPSRFLLVKINSCKIAAGSQENQQQ